MKKMICLALIVLAIVCVFTGCSTTAYTGYGNGRGRTGGNGNMDNGNVSTSRDGTVNGQNRSGMPNMGIDMEIGKNAGR